ncbi:MAG: GspE/PulE family protein [Candidatus Binatia bacterium]|nr:GspE/PulE family protein [Candidatus Binatia bacterium]
MEQRDQMTRRLDALQEQVAYSKQVQQVTNRIHAAQDLTHLFVELRDELLGLFDAEHITLYALDEDRRELYSKFLDLNQIREIRVPLSDQSIAGFVARHRRLVNIADAYDSAELARISPLLSFDRSWDQKTGVRTTQVLAAPLYASNKLLTGVIQLINKKGASCFTSADEARVQELAQTLGIALYNQYRLAKRKPTRFDALVTHNLISQVELDAAITEARETQRAVEAVLMEKYHVSRQAIGQALSAFYACPFFDPEEQLTIDSALVKNLNLNYLKTHHWLPLRRADGAVEILIDDPHSFQKRQDINRLFPQQEIRYVVGLREDIARVTDAVIVGLESNAHTDTLTALLGQLAHESQEKESRAGKAALVDENDSAVVRLVNQIILDACRRGASDIHIEPYGEAQETLIRFRVDGHCHEYLKVPAAYRRAIASRLKVMAHLDIAERRKPQDGKIRFALPDRTIELRIATIPTTGADNEDVVLRILTASKPLPLEQLAMSERTLGEFRRLLDKPYGLILCVGPTGSGKTTTLHAALASINRPERKIWTAEDPVEITQYGLRQVQVHPRIGFTFAAALRAFLRADPDVIMVGEIRDRETAEICIEASLTGHLVLSTLHTNSAAETVIRLLEMGMDPFNFADALLGILAQRLARTVCQYCKVRYRPPREDFDTLATGYGREAFARRGIVYDEKFFLYRGKGCDACHQTGYRGRIGLHELLVATEEIKSLIHARAPAAELFRVAVAQGMTTLVQDGIVKCLQGWTDYNQVKAVAMR